MAAGNQLVWTLWARAYQEPDQRETPWSSGEVGFVGGGFCIRYFVSLLFNFPHIWCRIWWKKITAKTSTKLKIINSVDKYHVCFPCWQRNV